MLPAITWTPASVTVTASPGFNRIAVHPCPKAPGSTAPKEKKDEKAP